MSKPDISERIKSNQNKDDMLRRSLERIVQLYTDKSHFIYELLQNAEDTGARGIRFDMYDDRLEVFHDGRPFTEENLQSLCDIGKSDKETDLNQIGEFGVGFKSVFGICETVKLYSEPENYKGDNKGDFEKFAIEIKDFTNPVDIEYQKIDSQYTTKFVFPFAVGHSFSGFDNIEKLKYKLSDKLKNLGGTTLLFMRNLEVITYNIQTEKDNASGDYLLEKEPLNDFCTYITTFGERKSLGGQREEEANYLKFTRKLDEESVRTVDIAFAVVRDDNGKYICVEAKKDPNISVYFPTETESKLKFIVQGPFRTTPNRTSIPTDDEDNQKLVKFLSDLYRSAIMFLVDKKILDLSFIINLPISPEPFDYNNLFYPFFEETLEIFKVQSSFPTDSGKYIKVSEGKLIRGERIIKLIPDELLSTLLRKKHSYWLPREITETGKYGSIFSFLTKYMGIEVIRPEDVCDLVSNNKSFLKERDTKWLAEFYYIMDGISNHFNPRKTNKLTAEIIKTETGDFVAPYRMTEDGDFIPNVFLPTDEDYGDEINILDRKLYKNDSCSHFFTYTLRLSTPDDYELFIKDLKSRHGKHLIVSQEQNIKDIKKIIYYLSLGKHSSEIMSIIKDVLRLKCKDGSWENPYSIKMYFPVAPDGTMIEEYFKNILDSIKILDVDFYTSNGIEEEDLLLFNINNDIMVGSYKGDYDEFSSDLSIDCLKSALDYITNHPDAEDSVIKSKTIIQKFIQFEDILTIVDYYDQRQYCEMVKAVNKTRKLWSGKWVYNKSGDLVDPKTISKYDLNTNYYGNIEGHRKAFACMGFKKTEEDTAEEIRKNIPKEKLDILLESELKKRYGINLADVGKLAREREKENRSESGLQYIFPSDSVKNFDSLKRHAVEMLSCANPVAYAKLQRSIRVSKNDDQINAYLECYKYDVSHRYACQACHKNKGGENSQIFKNNTLELYPMYLKLCPNCAEKYRKTRNKNGFDKEMRNKILEIDESTIKGPDHISVFIDGFELWFTQTHFAEVQELVRLLQEFDYSPEINDKHPKKTISINNIAEETLENDNDESKKEYNYEPEEPSEDDDNGLLIGKTVIRRTDRFKGVITGYDGKYFDIKPAKKGEGKKTVRILDYYLLNEEIYEIIE